LKPDKPKVGRFYLLPKIHKVNNHGRPIRELKERDDIVIKSADKGSAIVVMDKVDYLEEENRQLTDERFKKIQH
jgi:soluble P-type ATPase